MLNKCTCSVYDSYIATGYAVNEPDFPCWASYTATPKYAVAIESDKISRFPTQKQT